METKLKDRFFLIKRWFENLSHDWYHGDFTLGVRSKYTGDLIGRSERHCMLCDKKQMRLSFLSLENQKKAHMWFGANEASFAVWIKQYHTFEKGDMMDRVTRKILTVNVEETPTHEINTSI